MKLESRIFESKQNKVSKVNRKILRWELTIKAWISCQKAEDLFDPLNDDVIDAWTHDCPLVSAVATLKTEKQKRPTHFDFDLKTT